MQLEPLFARLGYSGPRERSFATLRALHRAFVEEIPFENLDLHLGRTIELAPEALVAKLIDARRGGWCFELNGLFALTCEALGFEVRRCLARVWFGREGGLVPPTTHQCNLVRLEAQWWLADVGFGGTGIRELLLLEAGPIANQQGERYRLRDAGTHGLMLQGESEGAWKDYYSFEPRGVQPIDFHPPNFYLQHAPDAHFRFHRVVARCTPSGRVFLHDLVLKQREGGIETARTLSGEDEYRAVLAVVFGIELPGNALLMPPTRGG